MKLGNEGIKRKFDDIDTRVDFLIALCQSLQAENKAVGSRLKELEEELADRSKIEGHYTEQETMIETKIDGLLSKLDGFSSDVGEEDLSKMKP